LVTPENNENTNDNTPYFSWSLVTDVNENYRIVICRDLGGAPNPSDNIYDNWLEDNFDNFDTHSENALPDNLWWWGVRVENQPGDATQPWTWYCLRVDTVAPPAPDLSSPPDGENTNQSTLTLSWGSVTDPSPGAGVLCYELWLDNKLDFSTATVENVYGTSRTLTLTDNLYYWKVRAWDNAGNVGSFSATWCFRVDTVRPTGSIVINNGATYTNSPEVELTLSAWDDVGVHNVYLSNDGSSWMVLPLPPDGRWVIRWSVGPGDGTKTVYARFQDVAGNLSDIYSDNIILDTTAPAGSISINAGAAYTNSTSVILTLTASDANGVSQMCFSNDGSTWTDWEAYAASKSWTLSAGDGIKTVYVKFRDVAGNTSVYSDDIILDTAPPAPPTFLGPLATAPSTATGWSYTSTVPSFTLSGRVEPRCRVYLNDALLPVAADGSFSKTLTLAPGPNRFTLRIVDQAGNVTTRTLDVYFPGTPPVPSAAPAIPGAALLALSAVALIGAGVFLFIRLR
jgi:hypothetical protein